jgi:hypothetical protein
LSFKLVITFKYIRVYDQHYFNDLVDRYLYPQNFSITYIDETINMIGFLRGFIYIYEHKKIITLI